MGEGSVINIGRKYDASDRGPERHASGGRRAR